MASATDIVIVNVSQTIAPTPSTLQRTGAFISQGATTLAAGTSKLLTQLSDLSGILSGGIAITTMAWTSNTVTVTTAGPHGFPVSAQPIILTVSGATPVGYNGTFSCTVTSTTQFTYPSSANPGTMVTQGVVTPEDVAELAAMNATFFTQGSGVSVYVLELGAGGSTAGVTALTTYMSHNPNQFYGFLVPRSWAAEATFPALVLSYASTTSKVYFWITATSGNYTNFTDLMKDAIVMIEAPSIPVTEFSLAAMFYVALNYNPSSTNQVTPMAYSFVFGVTPYPTLNNGALLTTWKTAGVNIIGTGAKGGISDAIVYWGTTMDGHDFNYWYSVDWVQINLSLDLSNEIINGSNNPQAPLYYNQAGINRLRARAQSTMTRAISYGLALSPVTVTAVSFVDYVTTNPSDYSEGQYNGLAVVYTPARGFTQIIFNVQVDDLPAA